MVIEVTQPIAEPTSLLVDKLVVLDGFVRVYKVVVVLEEHNRLSGFHIRQWRGTPAASFEERVTRVKLVHSLDVKLSNQLVLLQAVFTAPHLARRLAVAGFVQQRLRVFRVFVHLRR